MEHSFDARFAEEFGVNSAIIFKFIATDVLENKARKSDYCDGKYWCVYTIKSMHKLFPYMSEKTIQRCVKKLADNGLIISRQNSCNVFDKTNWYTLTKVGEAIAKGC